ncbi:hypothetical protein F2P81_002969 [Scophthalmus maximus]|uniref:Uncharacterized protein n=1 Tax=Scophthalmus maximus TaxID=52904 RepID=A0A6A4TLQ6_SCOMX|nr:hypothetical protein F2P81_002969 [Scophthalmus maximus]
MCHVLGDDDDNDLQLAAQTVLSLSLLLFNPSALSEQAEKTHLSFGDAPFPPSTVRPVRSSLTETHLVQIRYSDVKMSVVLKWTRTDNVRRQIAWFVQTLKQNIVNNQIVWFILCLEI